MAREGFYNENEYRDYPFMTRVSPLEIVPCPPGSESGSSARSESSASAGPELLIDLPHEAIVDFGAIMAIDSRYHELKHCVWLDRITRWGDYFIYEFQTNATGAASEVLRFTRHLNDPEFTQEWAKSVPIGSPDVIPSSMSSESSSTSSRSSSSESCRDVEFDCEGAPKWEGFLITGRMGELAGLIVDGETVTFPSGLWVVEPARMQSLVNTYARTINLANRERVQQTDPCSESSDAGIQPPGDFLINQTCMDGDLAFKEGYNCQIRQVAIENKLTFGAGIGAGAGQACELPALTLCPPLVRGTVCGDTVRAVNGMPGPALRIEAGPGMTITEEENGILINADLRGFALCFPGGGSDSSQPSNSSSLGGWLYPSLREGLVRLWDAHGTNGEDYVPDDNLILPEWSGLGVDGIVTNWDSEGPEAIFQDDDLRYSFRNFGGPSMYVNGGSISMATGEITMAYWAKRDWPVTPGQFQACMSIGTYSAFSGFTLTCQTAAGFHDWFVNESMAHFNGFTIGSNPRVRGSVVNGLTTDSWHGFLVRARLTNIQLWRDAANVSIGGAAAAVPALVAQPIYLGATPPTSDYPDCVMRQHAVWNRWLDDDEVANYMSSFDSMFLEV